MGQLNVGFARVNITPPMGIPVAGYYQLRLVLVDSDSSLYIVLS